MRNLCLLLVLFVSIKAFGHESTPVPVDSVTAEDVTSDRAVVTTKMDLKSKLGLVPQDAVFAAPRNYRGRGLENSSNADSLEPLAANGEDQAE